MFLGEDFDPLASPRTNCISRLARRYPGLSRGFYSFLVIATRCDSAICFDFKVGVLEIN